MAMTGCQVGSQDPGFFLSHFGYLPLQLTPGRETVCIVHEGCMVPASHTSREEPDPQSIPIGDLNLQNLGGEQIRRSVAG